MTKQEAWVRFVAGAMADGNTSVPSAVKCADRALAAMLERWPDTPGDDPMPPLVETEDGATREG